MPDGFLKKNMKEKNDEQLRHVLQNPNQFSSEEITNAKEILEERTARPVFLNTTNKENNKPSKSYREKPISPNFSLRAIAVYQLLSSILILPQIFSVTMELNIIQWGVFIVIILLYLATLASAILIFQKKQLGLLIGLVTALLQSLQIHIGGFIYYATGFIYVFFSVGNYTGFSAGIIPSFLVSFEAQTELAFVGINIVSVIAFYLLYRASTYCDESDEFPLHLY